LLYAALIPHLVDASKRHKLFAGDGLAGKTATFDFPTKTGDGHPATRKGEGYGI
jgi:hypothetical protein